MVSHDSHDHHLSSSNPIHQTNTIADSFSIPIVNLRKSSRTKQAPSYLQDYHCQLAFSSNSTSSNSMVRLNDATVIDNDYVGIPYSLFSILNYDHLSPSYKAYPLFPTLNQHFFNKLKIT
jgi:hypothetical protein